MLDDTDRRLLRQLLADPGIATAELADRAGLSRKTVNTVENGVFTPSVLVALTLAQALGVPLDALFTLED